MPDTRDLSLLIQSRTPIILLETRDERRALEMLGRVAMANKKAFYQWTISDGLRRWGGESTPALSLESPEQEERRLVQPGASSASAPAGGFSPAEGLRSVRSMHTPALVALCDFHPFLANYPEHVRLLKDIALAHEENGHTLLLLSHAMELPPELQGLVARYQLRLPDDAQLSAMLREEARTWSLEAPGRSLAMEPGILRKLVRNLRGLSHRDARRLARQAIRNDGALTEHDLPMVNQAKFQLMDMEGIISFEHDTANFAAVGGLKRLKAWVKQRENAWQGGVRNGDRPRGLLLLGVQGGGKSLAARAIAGLWGLPLLRLDMAALYNKYIGETERNLRESLALAVHMSPCVMWIDEIEKGLAVGQGDDGTTRRMIGTLLTWMAEQTAPVFVVATANDVSQLPPELMRKGRLDEVFFVDLPSPEVRAEIFAIHLRKRELDPAQFPLALLAANSEGFSGAEIEQAVVSAIFRASAERVPVSGDSLLVELDETVPLSVLRAEDMQSLREWARERTVQAD